MEVPIGMWETICTLVGLRSSSSSTVYIVYKKNPPQAALNMPLGHVRFEKDQNVR